MSQTASFDRYLTAEEQRRLLATISRYGTLYARRDHAWIRLMLHTGIRLGALARYTVGDARRALRERRLVLRQAIQKRGQGHEMHLSRGAERALRDLLAVRRAQGHPAEDLDAPLVMGRKGAGLAPRSYQDRLTAWARAAGLPPEISPHWLRHTLAKRLVAQSTHPNPLGIVQRVLGHRSVASTGVYTAPDKEAVQEALEGVR